MQKHISPIQQNAGDHMNTVKTGIDGMSLTFAPSSKYSNDPCFTMEAITSLFPCLTADMFCQEEKSPLSFYKECHSFCYRLKHPTKESADDTTKYRTLIQYHSGCTSNYGSRNLLQIHGLCFSDSALNWFSPINLGELVYWSTQYKANVSGFDVSPPVMC